MSSLRERLEAMVKDTRHGVPNLDEIARDAARLALEEAAKACETVGKSWEEYADGSEVEVAAESAARIRTLAADLGARRP